MKSSFPKSSAGVRLSAYPRVTMPGAWARLERRHRLAIGDAVTLLSRAGDIRAKRLDQQLESGRFEITRLLPAEGDNFQYRVKDLATGRERVVAEEQIAPHGI